MHTVDATEMTPMLVTIPGSPIPHGRPRVDGRRKSGKRFGRTPERSRKWREFAQLYLIEAMRGQNRIAGPVSVLVVAIWSCPKDERRVRNPRPRRWQTKSVGDADNVAKAVLDAANGIVYADDAQVAELVVRRYVGDQSEPPRVMVTFARLAELTAAIEGAA